MNNIHLKNEPKLCYDIEAKTPHPKNLLIHLSGHNNRKITVKKSQDTPQSRHDYFSLYIFSKIKINPLDCDVSIIKKNGTPITLLEFIDIFPSDKYPFLHFLIQPINISQYSICVNFKTPPADPLKFLIYTNNP
ncbi:MAG: hypothetical protein KGJ07_10145 [Patescibacteria group bacterium]|nr:hypothetical protein [Patescibacteria group bacterium]